MTITTCTVKTYEMNEYERSLWANFEDFVCDLYSNLEEDEMCNMLHDVMNSVSAFKDNYINDSDSTWRIEERSAVTEER